nr:MAG TPA: hypothetical protein [Caudoviricetes sp.]
MHTFMSFLKPHILEIFEHLVSSFLNLINIILRCILLIYVIHKYYICKISNKKASKQGFIPVY